VPELCRCDCSNCHLEHMCLMFHVLCELVAPQPALFCKLSSYCVAAGMR
jgi:hypothetical protein